MDISVIIPLYNEEESLPELFAWIEKVMDANKYTYEVILLTMEVLMLHGMWFQNTAKHKEAI